MRRLWRLWVWRHRVTWRHRWRQSTRRGNFLIGSPFFTRTPKSLQFPRYLVKVADKQTRRLNCVRLSLRQQVVVAVFRLSQPATWSYHAAVSTYTAPVRSVSLVQSAGMPYRIIESRQIFRSMFLNTTFLFCRYWHYYYGSALETLVDALYKCILNWTELNIIRVAYSTQHASQQCNAQ